MQKLAKSILVDHLEELIESISRKERKFNNQLKGKTKKIIKLTNYLKHVSKLKKENF